MFNNILLDVFVGLVLVYLLYSLFVTIVSEIVVTWMALRSRILRVSIEKMLNDGYFTNINDPKYRGFSFIIQRFFLKEFPDFKYSLAGKFYTQPSIKYMANRAGEQRTFFTQTKPSYLTDENFARSLIQLLMDKGVGATEMEKVHFCLSFNTHEIQPGTLKNLRDMAESAGNDLEVFKNKLKHWYNETQDRANGWYKRKLQLILFWMGFVIAVVFNVDSIQIAKILSKDKDARRQLVNMGIELAKDSTRYGEFISNADSVHTKAILDSGYARISKDINEASLVLGLGWGTDKLTKMFSKKLDRKKDSVAYFRLAPYPGRFDSLQQEYFRTQDEYLIRNKSLDSAYRFLKEKAVDSLIFRLIPDSLVKYRIQVDSVQAEIVRLQSQNSRDSLLFKLLSRNLTEIKSLADSVSKTAFVSVDSIYQTANDKIVIKGSIKSNGFEKALYVFGKMFNWQSLTGFFITGLMISLGAPFWFDLLKKLVSIRGSGVNPLEKKQKNDLGERITPVAPVPQPTTTVVAGNMVDEAMRLYGGQLKQIAGVRSVFKVTDASGIEKIIRVNVTDDITKKEVETKFPQLKVGNTIVKYEINISGTPITHAGNTGTISNSSGKNGFGTLGCQLQRTDTGSMHILSCWHVLKGNTRYSEPDEFRNIRDHASQDFAERWAGNIQGAFDYGLARCRDDYTGNYNVFLQEKLGMNGGFTFRPLNRTDADLQIPVKYFDCLSGIVREGFVLTECDEVAIDYMDQTRLIKDVLVLTDNTQNTISRPGNSGSLVFDKDNIAIGMIISGDLHYTYAVKLSHIFGIHTEMKIV